MATTPRIRPRRTPREVALPAVAAAVRALDLPTAAEVARALALAGGVPVNGRGARMLAQHAGAVGVHDDAGVTRYWLPLGAMDPGAEAAAREQLLRLRRAAAAGRHDGSTWSAAVTQALDEVAARHPAFRAPGLQAAFLDRAADTARLHGWPET